MSASQQEGPPEEGLTPPSVGPFCVEDACSKQVKFNCKIDFSNMVKKLIFLHKHHYIIYPLKYDMNLAFHKKFISQCSVVV